MSEERDIIELLADVNFCSLLNETARRCIPWDDFLGLAEPYDMSPLETWHILNDIGRCVAVSIPVPDVDDNCCWYRRTHEIDDAALTIACACRTDSSLHRTMTTAAAQHFLVKSRVGEIIAAAQFDGLAISEKDAEILLRLDCTPQSATERLLLNTLSVFERLPDLIGEPFSRELFRHMRDLLLDGIDPTTLKIQPPMQGIGARSDDRDDERLRRFADRQMDLTAAYLNRETSDPSDLPVLQSMVVVNTMRFYHPFGTISSQIGHLSARLFALKNDLPVIGMLPILRAMIDWETGAITPPTVSFDPAMFAALRQRNPLDLTVRQTLTAQLILITLKDLELYVETWERRDKEMREILREVPLLNQRQRSILARALRDPEAEFHIRYHSTNHNIHYTTARRDLFNLQERGLLVIEQRGKAFVFLRGRQLDELDVLRKENLSHGGAQAT
jgi:Fic family protein